MPKLEYCGPKVEPGGGIPLPEGWPMATHLEDDEALAAEKVASGKYRLADEAKAPKGGASPASTGKEGDD